MSTYNICLYGEISIIIPKLSQNALICSAALCTETLRVRCPSIFSLIAIELNVLILHDDFSLIVIELTFVILGHRFEKAGSVL